MGLFRQALTSAHRTRVRGMLNQASMMTIVIIVLVGVCISLVLIQIALSFFLRVRKAPAEKKNKTIALQRGVSRKRPRPDTLYVPDFRVEEEKQLRGSRRRERQGQAAEDLELAELSAVEFAETVM